MNKQIYYLIFIWFTIFFKDIIKINEEILEKNSKKDDFNFDLSKLENISNHKTLVLFVENEINLDLSIYNEKENRTIIFCNDESFFGKTYIPIDYLYLKKPLFFKIKIKKKFDESKMKFLLIEIFNINIKEELFFISYFSSEIKFKLNYNEIKNIDKLQFYIISSIIIEENIEKNSYIELLLNKKNEVPTLDNYDMKTSSKFQNGLLKTIRKDQKYFCNKNCIYHGLIQFYEIKKIILFINFNIYSEKILLQDNYYGFIDEILKNEKITYIFDISNFIDYNFNFSLEPLLGDADLYINYDKNPENLNSYNWISNTKFNEDILITKEEIKKLGGVKLFYVTLFSKKSSTIKFKLNCFKNLFPNLIKLENTYRGKLFNGEIINYLIQFDNNKPDVLELLVNLKSDNGNSDLYVKECLERDINCQITMEDIKNKEKLKAENGIIFLYSENKNRNKLLFNFNCINKNIKNMFSNGYLVSNSCMFIIGIYGNDNLLNNFDSYSLLVSGYQNHWIINSDEKNYFEIGENEKIYLKYTVPKIRLKNIKLINFRFFSTIGDSNIYLSRINPYPNKDDNIQELNFLQNVNQIKVIEQNIIQKEKNLNLNGNFYFSINSKSYSYIIIYPEIKNEKNEDIEERLIDSIDYNCNFTSKFKNYYIETNLKNDVKNNIYILIKPIIGNFKICIQKNIKQYNPEIKCDIEDDSNFIEINNNSKNFIRNGFYSITIIDLEYNEDFIEEKTFDLLFYYSNNMKSILINKPGKVIFNKINNENDLFYKINIELVKKKMIFILDNNNDIIVYGSKKVLHPDNNNSDFILNNYKNIIVLNHNYFKEKNKYIYLRIKSKNNIKNKFNLSYTIDDYPFNLYDSKSQLYFIPENNEYIVNYKYKIEQEYDLNISFTNFNYFVSCKINILSDFKDIKYKYEIKNSKEDEITIPKNKFNQLINPILLINFTIDAENNKNIKYEKLDCFTYYYKNDLTILEITNKISELIPFKPKQNKARKGTFKYFYLELEEENDFTISLISKIGDVNLYIQEGKNNFPSSIDYYKKQTNNKENEIKITKEEFKIKNKVMTKIWTIGVFSEINSKFSIIFLINLNYSNVLSNKIYEINLSRNDNFFFNYFSKKNEIFNIYIWSKNSDIEIFHNIWEENKNENSITNEINYNFLDKYEINQPPKYIQINNTSINCNYIFDLKNNDNEDTKIIFIIINDDNKEIELSSNKIYNYVLNDEKKQLFEIDFEETGNLNFKLEVEFGDIELLYDTDLNIWKNKKFETSKDILILKSNQNKEIKLNLKKNIKNVGDIFNNKFYFKIRAIKYSKFSFILRINNSFINLEESIPFNYKTSKSEDLYFYYFVSEQENKSINLQIKYNIKNNLNFKFWFTENIENIYNKIDYEFLPINTKKKYKLFILGTIINHNFQTIWKNGVYLIKINKSNEIFDFQVKISFESKYLMKINTSTFENIRNKELKIYTINIPFPGILKINVLNCFKNINIKSIIKGNAELIKEIYDNNISINQENYKLNNKYSRNFNFDIKKPSTIKILIEDKSKNNNRIDNNFILINEFKSNSQNLFLIDYFIKEYSIKYDNKNHNIKFNIFKVKDQFSIDYKFIDEIKVIVDFYITNSDSMNKFKICNFLNDININNIIKYKFEILLKKENNFKNDELFNIKLNNNKLNSLKENDLEIYIITHVYLIEKKINNFLNSKYVSFPIYYYSFKKKELKPLFWIKIIIFYYLYYNYLFAI